MLEHSIGSERQWCIHRQHDKRSKSVKIELWHRCFKRRRQRTCTETVVALVRARWRNRSLISRFVRITVTATIVATTDRRSRGLQVIRTATTLTAHRWTNQHGEANKQVKEAMEQRSLVGKSELMELFYHHHNVSLRQGRSPLPRLLMTVSSRCSRSCLLFRVLHNDEARQNHAELLTRRVKAASIIRAQYSHRQTRANDASSGTVPIGV